MTPSHRIEPGPGQESVWDYPRPPKLEEVEASIQVIFNRVTIADTRSAMRVLETSHPPVYYLPPADIQMEYLHPLEGTSWCEWKGNTAYFDVRVEDAVAEAAAWAYPDPTASFARLKDRVAFYAGPMDACLVNGERVTPQPGGFYGGWITADVVGPFKGTPGTRFW